jgi:hypothetical protein
MAATSLRDRWLEAITSDPEEDADVVRAAAWLFIQLGLVYVWRIDDLEDDIERSITALRAVQATEEIAEDDDIVEAIAAEIRELESRRSSKS